MTRKPGRREFLGLAALAAPVFDYAGAIQGVVTLIGPSEAFPADLSSPQGGALREAAASLCARLGHSP